MANLTNLTGMTLNMIARDYEASIDEELKKIFNDLEQRGHDGQKRNLTIKLSFKKNAGSDLVYIIPEISASYPKVKPSIVQAKLVQNLDGLNSTVVFNPESLEKVDQLTIETALKNDAANRDVE